MDKSKAATFFLSLVPGLGHFYLGQMNRGLQLMIAFFGSMLLFDLLRVNVSFVLPIIWFFGIFDALQQYQKIDREKRVIDSPFIPWKGHLHPQPGWLGWAFVVLGVYLLFDNLLPRVLGWGTYELVRTVVIALLLIYLGFRIITGKKLFPSFKTHDHEGSHRP
ncbi:hypothetical protein [Paludifilum halophilum]|uniref:TM2 domain-containing protein n=1 Tax=Paludifilum halophilum TaxID=1642702 RepID=A0A235B7F0_9BACL|nr:hypothetical protein [Paludifilum halophilum]OYD07525.1 hypothetical protein CHM34_11565 [Paludifilum halophilum]